jgi:hypothetical protein|tara:strand:- start:9993 stop:10283 length:291 start_codon:yes stop_codon:yes gene_type:complete
MRPLGLKSYCIGAKFNNLQWAGVLLYNAGLRISFALFAPAYRIKKYESIQRMSLLQKGIRTSYIQNISQSRYDITCNRNNSVLQIMQQGIGYSRLV